MPLQRPTIPPIERVGRITARLTDPDGTNPNRSVQAIIKLESNEGEFAGQWVGDAQPHLSQQSLASLAAVLDEIRGLAEQELLDE